MDHLQNWSIITSGVFCLLITTVIVGCAWIVQYKSKRSRLYELIGKMRMPPGLPLIGNALLVIGTPTHVFNVMINLFFEYGPNFVMWWLHIPIVVIGKPEDLGTLMMSQSCVEKGYFYEFTKGAVGNGLFSAPVHIWRRNRKIIQPTFNSKILNSFVPIFGATSSICVNEILPAYVNQKDIDWYSIFSCTNLDTISQTAMGVNTDAQRREVPFGRAFDKGMRAVFLRMTNVFLHPDFIFKFTKLSAELKTATDFVRKFTYEVLAEKKKKFKQDLEDKKNEVPDEDAPTKRKVFLELLLELDHKGMKFTDEELADEVMTFFVGGTDTSAVTSCFFLSMMGMHQNIQQQVFEEIMEVIGPDKVPSTDDIAKMDLLERCLKETMRIFPPAPVISREVTGKEIELSDCTIPVGAVLLFSIFYTHRCSDYWDEPLKFDPDRFLPEAMAKRHPFTYLPFSGGLRSCIGMRYSYMNLKILQSMVLRKYKVYCDYKTIEEIKLKNCIVIRPIDGFKFYLEERK